MITRTLFAVTTLVLILSTAINTDARFYSSVECQCHGGYASGGTIKIGMGLYEVVKICGPPTRMYRPYVQNEVWVFSPSQKRHETAVYRHFLFRQREWKKPKIFRFRDLKLYQIYDYGTAKCSSGLRSFSK